jgi:hypothetical protein
MIRTSMCSAIVSGVLLGAMTTIAAAHRERITDPLAGPTAPPIANTRTPVGDDASVPERTFGAVLVAPQMAEGAAAATVAELRAARSQVVQRTAAGGREYALVSSKGASPSLHGARGAAGRAAAAQVAEPMARSAALKDALEEITLRAPFDGGVTGKYFEAGMNLHTKETVVRVVGGGNGLRLRMALLEAAPPVNRAKSKASMTLDDGR